MRALMIAAAAAGALLATEAVAKTLSTAQNADAQLVSFRGVDFANPQAVDGFYARLRNSAREACGSGVVQAGARASRNDRACTERIVNEAVGKMQRPLLTARHDTGVRTRYATGF